MMKFITRFSLLLFAAILVHSCDKTEIPDDPFPSEEIEGCYVINFGNFGAGGASISKYDYKEDRMNNFFYQTQNGGNELLSNIQFALPNNDSIYLIGNVADQLLTVNPLMEQSLNGVSEDLENPRFCVADGDYLYVSCWGANPDYTDMPNSYISKFNTITRKVEKKIMVPGGPEGLAIVNGKLYAALNYINQIAVVKLSDESVSSISTPAVSSYFVKDINSNLYFTMLSTYADFSETTGLGFINTTTDELGENYILANVSSSYGSIIQANNSFSKIYVTTSAYDANWNLTGAVSVFDVATKSFDDINFVEDVAGISGLSINPVNNDVYIFSAQSTTGAGIMQIYTNNGTFEKEYEVGAFPIGAFYLN